MGNQVKLIARSCAGALVAVLAQAPAEAAPLPGDPALPGAGIEVWSSTDSDKTSVVKLLGRAFWDFEGPAKFGGIDLERAWFAPQGQATRKQTRVYLDLADSVDDKWKWRARIGTNGHTVLGSASVRASDWSKEFFVEREVVETPLGLDKGIYYTFAGASADLVSTDRNTANLMVGFQKFSGRNDRYHVRGTLVHVVSPKLGLSVQLRARYFHSTLPGEFDYYSPRDFAQLIPVVQIRRFTRTGWMYLIAFGYGGQRATASRWQAARLADVRLESPARSKKMQVFVQVQYSNSSLVGAASSYSYVVGRAGLSCRF